MKTIYALLLIICFAFLALPTEAETTNPLTDVIASIDSSTKITGIASVPDKPDCVIVNDTLVWEYEKYTFNPETGKIVVRAKLDEKEMLPEISLHKITPDCRIVILAYRYWVKTEKGFQPETILIFKKWRS